MRIRQRGAPSESAARISSGGNRADAERRVEHHGEDHRVDDDEGHRAEAEAEPDQQERQPGDVADGLKEQEDRPERLPRDRAQPDQQAERDADQDADRDACGQPADAVLEIGRQDALVGERQEGLQHVGRRGKKARGKTSAAATPHQSATTGTKGTSAAKAGQRAAQCA